MKEGTVTFDELQFLRELHFIEAGPATCVPAWSRTVAVPSGTALH